MTEEVGDLVLRDNYAQNQALSNAVVQAASMVDVHVRYLRHLETDGGLDRGLEFLPGEEALSERRSEGGGLTAPEFAVVLAYTKLKLYGELMESDAPEDPYLSGELEQYFPAPLRERFRDRMRDHRLRRELVATQVSNGVVNKAGTTYAFRMAEETGAGAPEIARAYAAAREIFAMRSLWTDIERLDNQVEARVQTGMLLDARKLVERASRWLLRNRRSPLDVSATISYFGEGTEQLSRRTPDLLLDGDREILEEKSARLVEAGVPPDLARRAAVLDPLFSALDVVDIAATSDESVETVATVYFTLGDRLRIHWLRGHVEALPRQDRWQTLARAALRDDLYSLQAEFTAGVLRGVPEGSDAGARVETWIEDHRTPVERTIGVLRDVNASGTFDLSTLSVALRELRNLATHSGASRVEVEAPAR
jgi:glutamate dehydrogenase